MLSKKCQLQRVKISFSLLSRKKHKKPHPSIDERGQNKHRWPEWRISFAEITPSSISRYPQHGAPQWLSAPPWRRSMPNPRDCLWTGSRSKLPCTASYSNVKSHLLVRIAIRTTEPQLLPRQVLIVGIVCHNSFFAILAEKESFFSILKKESSQSIDYKNVTISPKTSKGNQKPISLFHADAFRGVLSQDRHC